MDRRLVAWVLDAGLPVPDSIVTLVLFPSKFYPVGASREEKQGTRYRVSIVKIAEPVINKRLITATIMYNCNINNYIFQSHFFNDSQL